MYNALHVSFDPCDLGSSVDLRRNAKNAITQPRRQRGLVSEDRVGWRLNVATLKLWVAFA